MQIFQLASFPIDQERSLDTVEQRLTSLFATIAYPVRLLAFSRAFDLRPALQRLQGDQRSLIQLARVAAPLMQAIDQLYAGDVDADPGGVVQSYTADELGLLLDLFAQEPQLRRTLLQDTAHGSTAAWGVLADALDSLLWRLPWLKEQGRFYEELQHRYLRATTFLVITWEPPDVSPPMIMGMLQQATGRPVQVLDHLPPLLQSTYLKQPYALQPESDTAPWLAAALSYEIQGWLDATTLHSLLEEKYDVALAIDIVTRSKDKAQRSAEMAYNAARLLALDTKMLDTRAMGVRDSAQRVTQELKHQSLHSVQMALLVSGDTADAVEQHYTAMEKRLGTQVKWFRPPYQQGEILKFFSTTPRAQIDAPLRPRSSLSHGVACLAGVLGYHRADRTDGIFFGIDAMHRAGLFFDLFADKQAAHITLLGMTGYGKTFFLNLLSLRSAVVLGYRVIGIDDFDNGPRIAAAAGAGGACYMLSMETPINILDVVYGEEAEGGWKANQVQHVIAQLSLLLGKPGKTTDGKDRLVPRDFEPEEAGVLDRALMRVYADVTPTTPLHAMPLLSDLIRILETLREPEAQRIGRTLRIKLYGTEDQDDDELMSVGQCFNVHTQVDWHFGADITYYNTKDVPEQYRPFFYLQIIGAILRYMRDPTRDLNRKTILAVDEYGYVTQIEALARLSATITKIARKFSMGLIAIDQNPLTFLESENGRYIFENCPVKISFRLDEKPARQLADAVRDMHEGHVEALTKLEKGQCVVVVRNDVYVLTAEASPRELRAFQ